MNIRKAAEHGYHIFEGEVSTSLLYRYGILAKDGGTPDDNLCRENGGVVTFEGGKRQLTVNCEKNAGGFRLRIDLVPGERLYGLGDANREDLMLRGKRVDIHKANVTAYGPMPVLMSTGGWGLVVNTTYDSCFDIGASDADTLEITADGGNIDFYLFRGECLKDVLGQITAVTGRAAILPKFAYGLVFVENDNLDARSLLWDIRTLRDKDIPCDVISLEPSWMSKWYDYSLEKKWNPKYPFQVWHNESSSDACTMFYPMREMGMQLSLWLCQEYDYFWAEEDNFQKEQQRAYGSDALFVDEHLSSPVYMDTVTDKNQPWFEHLKKFVDNGAAAFKLDGANQISSHPDRLWGGKYTDREVHNLLPVILEKQMTNGYKDYTGRRLMLFSAGAYIGTQQFSATWAGDTGSGPKVLLSHMNYAMCGHSNTSCDIEVKDLTNIHHCFLLPWAEYFTWAQWIYPWFLGEEKESVIRYYANLRSSLVPYIYTMAHTAYATGIPILRPLALMYEEQEHLANVKNAYMFGDKLYVGAFDMNLSLPEGKWTDYFNNDQYEGNIVYRIPQGKGGALMVRNGSVFVTMEPQKYVLEKDHDYIINVYPGGDDTFTLYEDDGFTYDYQEGKYAQTLIEMTESSEAGFVLTVHPREGSYEGRPDNGHDISANSIPEIKGMPPIRDMKIVINGAKPEAVTLDGEPVAFTYDAQAKKTSLVLPAALHSAGTVVYTVQMQG